MDFGAVAGGDWVGWWRGSGMADRWGWVGWLTGEVGSDGGEGVGWLTGGVGVVDSGGRLPVVKISFFYNFVSCGWSLFAQ